ncbi:hypothetical protein TSOC_007022, partial [Tetrabaena socialis]
MYGRTRPLQQPRASAVPPLMRRCCGEPPGMDKLFDLMMMGFKYQLLCSTKLDSMMEVTLLHLATVRSIVESLP